MQPVRDRSRILRSGPGWFKGELHAHSDESDGKHGVEEVASAAEAVGLDFLAISDHFTISQWRALALRPASNTLFLQSCEITSHVGHANLHGLTSWVDVFAGRPGWSMANAAVATRAQGGLFCVNHPLAGRYGWRDFAFDWDLADLMEVHHSLEGPNNDHCLGLWDHHLRLGRRLVGVAGTDSHDLYDDIQRLGRLVTWVHADELSEPALLSGLKRGDVYLTRGPQLRFRLRDEAGRERAMWQVLPAENQHLEVVVEIKTEDELLAFVLKDGFPWRSFRVTPASSWQHFALRDRAVGRCFFRLELHAKRRDETFPHLQWRNHLSMVAMSNPVFVG